MSKYVIFKPANETLDEVWRGIICFLENLRMTW